MAEYRQNANWCEADHPRDEDGKFACKPSKVVVAKKSKDKYRVEKDTLSVGEWRKYYDTLSQIKRGEYVNYVSVGNEIYFQINNKVVCTTYKRFGDEEVKAIYYFENADRAQKALYYLGADYGVKERNKKHNR